MTEMEYALVDSGEGEKLERFGPLLLARPCAQVVWKRQKDWQADARFSREGEMSWRGKQSIPETWCIEYEGVRFRLSPTDFGHLGVFPEHAVAWRWLRERLQTWKGAERPRVLNLFAYSGAATLVAAQEGAEVCHVDASQGMVAWARENAALNGLDQHPIRWIVDDVRKFLQREANRGRRYDIILLDPPSFGRGKKGEIFKIERDLPELLELCEAVLEPRAHGIFLSCHTPGYTPVVLENLLRQVLKGRKGRTDSGEMLLSPRDNGFSIPCGAFARWQYA